MPGALGNGGGVRGRGPTLERPGTRSCPIDFEGVETLEL